MNKKNNNKTFDPFSHFRAHSRLSQQDRPLILQDLYRNKNREAQARYVAQKRARTEQDNAPRTLAQIVEELAKEECEPEQSQLNLVNRDNRSVVLSQSATQQALQEKSLAPTLAPPKRTPTNNSQKRTATTTEESSHRSKKSRTASPYSSSRDNLICFDNADRSSLIPPSRNCSSNSAQASSTPPQQFIIQSLPAGMSSQPNSSSTAKTLTQNPTWPSSTSSPTLTPTPILTAEVASTPLSTMSSTPKHSSERTPPVISQTSSQTPSTFAPISAATLPALGTLVPTLESSSSLSALPTPSTIPPTTVKAPSVTPMSRSQLGFAVPPLPELTIPKPLRPIPPLPQPPSSEQRTDVLRSLYERDACFLLYFKQLETYINELIWNNRFLDEKIVSLEKRIRSMRSSNKLQDLMLQAVQQRLTEALKPSPSREIEDFWESLTTRFPSRNITSERVNSLALAIANKDLDVVLQNLISMQHNAPEIDAYTVHAIDNWRESLDIIKYFLAQHNFHFADTAELENAFNQAIQHLKKNIRMQ